MARYRSSFDGERRSKSLRSWVTPTEYKALELAAAESDTGLSDYVRQLCVRRLNGATAIATAQRNPAARAIADELRQIGTLLSALAASDRLNATEASELPQLLSAVKAALTRVIAL